MCAIRRLTYPEFSLSLNDAAYSQRQRRLALTIVLEVSNCVKSSVYLICDLLANVFERVSEMSKGKFSGFVPTVVSV